MFSSALSNVSVGTANALSLVMGVVIAIFLLAATGTAYYFWRMSRKTKAVAPAEPA